MILTPKNARALIAKHYPGMPFRITTGCTIGVRPVYETAAGLPTLAWTRLNRGRDSAVKVGAVLPGGSIDWNTEVSL